MAHFQPPVPKINTCRTLTKMESTRLEVSHMTDNLNSDLSLAGVCSR